MEGRKTSEPAESLTSDSELLGTGENEEAGCKGKELMREREREREREGEGERERECVYMCV